MSELEATPAEARRPRSTWKVLGSLVLAVVVGLVLVGLCVSAVTPERTLEVPRTDLGVDAPRFYPLPSFGADSEGRTFGVWLVLRDDGSADAFYARDPRSGCYLPWRPEFTFEGRTGWFRDPCHGSTYTLEGEPVFGPVIRGVDQYDTEVDRTTVTVALDQIRLGECRPGITGTEDIPCSEPGNPRYEDKQPTLLDSGQVGN